MDLTDDELDRLFGLQPEPKRDPQSGQQLHSAFHVSLTLPGGEQRTITVVSDGKTEAELRESLNKRFCDYAVGAMSKLDKGNENAGGS